MRYKRMLYFFIFCSIITRNVWRFYSLEFSVNFSMNEAELGFILAEA